mmetsp:Transcript_70664/g.188402  ORF Transcript_70664/g.188402 Transcript_70664/m.188402 type:complete len:383 (+) Transcript_70664:1464-2612(+)
MWRRELRKVVQLIGREQVDSQAWLDPSSSPCPLCAVRLGHRLGLQGGDIGVGVVHPLLHDPTVNHIDHIINGHRRLGDVGGKHNLPHPGRGPHEGHLLLLGRHQTVQGNKLEILSALVQGQVQLGDVAPPREEHQDGPVTLGLLLVEIVYELFDQLQCGLPRLPHRQSVNREVAEVPALCSRGCPELLESLLLLLLNPSKITLPFALALGAFHRIGGKTYPLHRVLQIILVHGEHPPLNVHGFQGRLVDLLQVSTEVFGLQSGGHENDLHLELALGQGVAEEEEQEVRVHIAFVDFVQNEAADAVQIRLSMQTSQDDCCGGVDKLGAIVVVVDKSNLVPHLIPQLRLPVLSHTLGQRDRRHATRLRTHDHLVLRNQPGVITD